MLSKVFKTKTDQPRKKRGVTLIIVAGVLAVLSALGAGFFTVMHMQVNSALHYQDAVRAQMMAEAGVHYALGHLRELTFTDVESTTSPWFTTDYMHGSTHKISFPVNTTGVDESYSLCLSSSVGPNSDRGVLKVEDAASKINLNACDNLGLVLDGLCQAVGSPLVPAEPAMLQPKRWAVEGADAALFGPNAKDTASFRDLRYEVDAKNRPVQSADGRATYGDGYAIAGYRGRNGPFKSLDEVKSALTFVDRDGDGLANLPLERMEIEAKFAAIRPYITIHSWIDTNTVCVGKFEWVNEDTVNGEYLQIFVDREKSWVADDPVNDPDNLRGSLRGAYLSIINGHGAGQLRRIFTNGTDWVGVRTSEKMTVVPGPISSYLIMAPEEAKVEDINHAEFADFPTKMPPAGTVVLPKTNPDGTFVANPKINYAQHPLCIHRSPVNINTASDKVLTALFTGINVQHGHPMSIGTDADLSTVAAAWFKPDPHGTEYDKRVLTYKGLKRLPVNSGRTVYDVPFPAGPATAGYDMGYINNYGGADPAGSPNMTEAMQLAMLIILAREKDTAWPYLNPITMTPLPGPAVGAVERGAFRGWDDLFFRVVRPWDENRFTAGAPKKKNIATMIMANFNSNTDLLKFNPNIEWIDRWGRNFKSLEPVMIYTDQPEPHNSNPPVADPIGPSSIPIFSTADPLLRSSRKIAGAFIPGAYITRNYRYRSDDLIDKSDLNGSTTEFTFDSSGIFEINSTGQVVGKAGLMAERKVESLVKVYDVWRESTQRQFVQGKISKAGGPRGSTYSGQVTRDAYNVSDRLALVTQPEPLVPLSYTVRDQAGNTNPENKEEVDSSIANTQKRNAFGQVVDINQPDVIANRVLPAGYDGQITLATNTSKFDDTTDKDTFLASFDGDLDTATCKGNGHEQAKLPHIDTGPLKDKGSQVRVVDTFGLLGIMNDTIVDSDPGVPMVDPADMVNGWRWVYRFAGVNAGLQPLKQDYYWNNVTLRQGDLRTDGVYLSAPGVSGNDATLKYLFGKSSSSYSGKENFDPGSPTGNCITMWYKPTWKHDDFRTHEFFNASNPGRTIYQTRGCYLSKYGQYVYCFADINLYAGHSANRVKTNDLVAFWEGGQNDWDCGGLLHGGYDNVDGAVSPNESPSFRVQPFRWGFTGMRRNYWSKSTPTSPIGDGPRGHLMSSDDYKNPKNLSTIIHHIRPFVDTQLDMEGSTTWKPDQFWIFRTADAPMYTPADIGDNGTNTPTGNTGQDVKWVWADPKGTKNEKKVFSINNLNSGSGPDPAETKITDPNNVWMHYRFMPDDGTFAVIDELKISSRDTVLVDDPASPDWGADRVVKEQSTSRYYLPQDPKDPATQPTFTSQTLLQSRLGYDKTSSSEEVTLVRVNWTVFTPRFMSEYKDTTSLKFMRRENLSYFPGGVTTPVRAFKGPFDYDAYNDDSYIGNLTNDLSGRVKSYISVNRPSTADYLNNITHASRGVEIELIQDPDGYSESGDEVKLCHFDDPNKLNNVSVASTPVRVPTHQLRYRVRFKYPLDRLVDPSGGALDGENKLTVENNVKQILLDTPVFDDISVTYFQRMRILSYREVME